MRRGHRLHSIGGYDIRDTQRFSGRLAPSGSVSPECQKAENEFCDAILTSDNEYIRSYLTDKTKPISFLTRWDFIQRVSRLVASTGNVEIGKDVVTVLAEFSVKSYDIGELFAIDAIAANRVELTLGLIKHWQVIRSELISSELDVINTTIYYAATRKLRHTETLKLCEAVIYYATVERETAILKEVLQWHEEQTEKIGASVKLNADCMIHATLEEDKETLQVLYSFGYRLGPDTDRRINKDYLKRIKLFRARASPVYNIVAFEDSQSIEEHDPLKRSFEYAQEARSYAMKIQDFTKEYTDIAQKCEDFAKSLLDRCTTKHEVQTLLQTRSYPGHTDANFNIAILDGHKEFVAHEKFQQLLHKKWGQRDRLQWKNTPSYNIFWSEMSGLGKFVHFLKQMFVFPFLPFVVLFSSCLTNCFPCTWFSRQSQIPVNRFIYWELSKMLFYAIVLMTLIDTDDVAWYDILAGLWICSYMLENFRTIHRLYRYSSHDDRRRVFKRWLTFKNIYMLSTDLVFLIALILRYYAYLNSQCRRGCPYQGNETAFIASAIWSVASLLTFLRIIQGGLMWRQTGPIIISMSYMILDVMVFLFIFVIVYISFTLSMVYIYAVYSDERTDKFNNHKSAFKLFFWAMIRTGNPQFADIRVYNESLVYNASCLEGVIDKSAASGAELVNPDAIKACGTGYDDTRQIEEEIPYVSGNIVWAVYQFTVVIVLLSVLRARMVNTYHRIFKEADVQWKYFRACIWWKYLDKDSILPPPFTVFYFLHLGLKYLWNYLNQLLTSAKEARQQTSKLETGSTDPAEADAESPTQRQRREQKQLLDIEKREFDKRYTHLMVMLINTPDSNGLNS